MAAGKRAGARPKRRFRPDLLALVLGIIASLAAWAYLVIAAITFGSDARGGDSAAWWLLALAAVGAMACLFLALVLGARASRALGITRDESHDTASAAPPTHGGDSDWSAPHDEAARGQQAPPGRRRASS